jgi:hypothetical protein
MRGFDESAAGAVPLVTECRKKVAERRLSLLS